MIALVRPFNRHADICGLLRAQLRELYAELVQVKSCDLFVELLRQHVHLVLVLLVVGGQFDLGDCLVGEALAGRKGSLGCIIPAVFPTSPAALSRVPAAE